MQLELHRELAATLATRRSELEREAQHELARSRQQLARASIALVDRSKRA
jgi:hypothetical protein